MTILLIGEANTEFIEFFVKQSVVAKATMDAEKSSAYFS